MNKLPLTEQEWRTIHNALSVYQNQFAGDFMASFSDRAIAKRREIQELMNKVRDGYIEKYEV